MGFIVGDTVTVITEQNGDKIDIEELSRQLACPALKISTLKGTGIDEVVDAAIKATDGEPVVPQHSFSGVVEHALAHIEERLLHDMHAEQQRWYAIKPFENDEKAIEKLNVSKENLEHISQDIKAAED